MNKIDVSALIMDEFKKLARTRSIEDIPVAEICERSSISRQTFYNYFHDKYDLISKIYRKVELNTMAEIKTLTESGEEVSWDIVIGTLLRKLAVDKEFYSNALRYSGQNNLKEMILYHVYNGYINEFTRRHNGRPDDATLFELRFNAYGTAGCMLDWIQSGMAADPNIISRRMFGCMPPAIRPYFD